MKSVLTNQSIFYFPNISFFKFKAGVTTVNATLTWVEDMLRASGGFDLVHLEAPNAFVAIDMTESPIQHLPKNQSRNYFGTKKRPTLKHKCSLI